MMRKFKKTKVKSIKKTLLFSMVSLAVTISVLCGAAAAIILYQNSNQNMVNSVNLASQAYVQVVQNKIQQYKTAIEQIATDNNITDRTVSAENIQAAKERLAKQYGFQSIHTASSNGLSDVNWQNVSDCEFFKQAMSGKVYLSTPMVSMIDSKQAIYLATRVTSSNGYQGIVFAELNADTFSTFLDKAKVGQSGYSFIADKTGTIIAHKDRSLVTNLINYIDKGKKDSSFSGVASVEKNMIAGKTGSQTFRMNGDESFVSYLPIPDTDGWSIAVTAKVSEMMASFYNGILITVILMAVFIFLSCVISFRVANPIAKPIVSLVRRIEGLADGDLHSEVPEIKTRDEVGMLATSFTSTVNTLNAHINEISTVLKSLAAGDCTVETQQEYKGDFIEIETALHGIAGNLNGIFTKINKSADQVASGAGQVASAAQALSQGATQQASSIEELSASIMEIADEVNQNASNAINADELSKQTSKQVEFGNEQMQQMIASMTQISKASNEIGKIIKTIEDIAFQTNILALNAAVEAARAGSAGRGFAVVAGEVRNLASKSAQAAKNTTALIENSVKAVKTGTKVAADTEASLGEMIESARKTTELIGKIAEASRHQSASIQQITSGVDQISAVVQTNSASSEQSAATSEELSMQAQALKETLSFLKLSSITDQEKNTPEVNSKTDIPSIKEEETNVDEKPNSGQKLFPEQETWKNLKYE